MALKAAVGVLDVGFLKEMAALKAPPALTASGSPKEDEQVVTVLQMGRRARLIIAKRYVFIA